MVAGGLGMLIFGLFFDWAKIDFMGVSATDGNAFDWARGWLSWILVIGTAVIAVLSTTGKLAAVKLPWNIVMVLASALATLFMVLLMITGALMNFTGSGGDLKDLTDFKKIKGSFDQE